MPSRARDDFFFHFASYGRGGRGRRDRLTPAQVQQIARTVGRTPEVMIKVLPKGATTAAAVRRHVDYIDRKGEVELETDDGQAQGRDACQALLKDWDMEIDEERRTTALTSRPLKSAPRLVHKLMLSMPPGTPPKKVLAAVRNFCREEFALQHRYIMALHTDQPHPHVHVVVKAISEQGQRLNIRNETLRRWREEFARHLRELGVEANATPRYIRGATTPQMSDGLYRTSLRNEATDARNGVDAVAPGLPAGNLKGEPGKRRPLEARRSVLRLWAEVGVALSGEVHHELSARVRRFAQEVPVTPINEAATRAAYASKTPHAGQARDGPIR